MPSELRNRIYEYVLCGKTWHDVSEDWRRCGYRCPFQDLEAALQISSVCKQIYAETNLLAFAGSTFKYANAPYFITWLNARTSSQRNAICRIENSCEVEPYIIDPGILIEYLKPDVRIRWLPDLPGLQLLTVILSTVITWGAVDKTSPEWPMVEEYAEEVANVIRKEISDRYPDVRVEVVFKYVEDE